MLRNKYYYLNLHQINFFTKVLSGFLVLYFIVTLQETKKLNTFLCLIETLS